MEPLCVTAHLIAGVACDGDLPLDGILAAAWMRTHHPDLYFSDTVAVREADLIDADLPLERRGADPWYWAASFAVWPAHTEGRDYWNKRYDATDGARVDFAGKRVVVIVEKGKYKAYHVPISYITAPYVQWWCYGDRAGIEALVADVWSIGKKRSQGWGAVRRWEVEPMDQDWSCYRDGAPTRTIPHTDGMTGAIGWRGYRPPYWHTERQGLVILPEARCLAS